MADRLNRPPGDPIPNDVTPAPPMPKPGRPLSDIQPHVAPTPPTPEPDLSPGPTPDDLTADALRHSLDRGRGGDKVDFIDPAAAPLGTDDEAGGHPPTREQIRMAAASELGPRPSEVEREARTIPHLANGGRVGIVPILLVAAVIVLMVVLFL